MAVRLAPALPTTRLQTLLVQLKCCTHKKILAKIPGLRPIILKKFNTASTVLQQNLPPSSPLPSRKTNPAWPTAAAVADDHPTGCATALLRNCSGCPAVAGLVPATANRSKPISH